MRATLILVLIAQIAAVTHAESQNLIGKWKVEIAFANQEHRSLQFEARADGKGSLLVVDPKAKVWQPPKSADARWTLQEANSVTFSGPVEFLIGNVGRDAGILMCKGKFETADLITGEVEFSPLVGERPSKQGTFKATRTAGDKE